MAELLTSPWFESLTSSSQAALAVLALLLFGRGTGGLICDGWRLYRRFRGKPECVKPTEPTALTARFLRLLSDGDWDVVRDEKESSLMLNHRSQPFSVFFDDHLTPVRFEVGKIDVEGRLPDSDREALDRAAEQRLDLVLAESPARGGTSSSGMSFEKVGPKRTA